MLTAALLISSSVAGTTINAQTNGNYGRWWWDASVGLWRRSTTNYLDGVKTTGYDQNDLRVSLGLNGFILHPSVASFRLETDLLFTQYKGSSDLDSDQFGYGADLNAFQRGAVPFNLYYRRQTYDYSVAGSELPSTLLRNPDTRKQWGGQAFIRRGAFGGTRFGISYDLLDYIDSETAPDEKDRQFVQWQRRTGKLNNQVKIERREQDFGRLGFKLEDLVANIDETAKLSERWRWVMNANGIQRETTYSNGRTLNTEDYRIRNQFQRSFEDRDYLDLRASVDVVDRDISPTLRREDVSVSYRWRPSRWQIAPFGRYSHLSSDGESLNSPQAGITVTWEGRARSAQVLLSGQAGYSSIEESSSTDSSRSSRFGASLGGTLRHGDLRGLLKSFEFRWTTNDFRIEREPVLELPDLGSSSLTLGAEDYYRTRITLGHANSTQALDGWGMWTYRTPSASGSMSERHFETLTGGLRWKVGRLSLQSNVGTTTDHDSMNVADNTLRYADISAAWQLSRFTWLRARYRMDSRSLGIAPDIDGDWLEASMNFQFGQLRLEIRAYENSEQTPGGRERTNRGMNFRLSTRFGGWLPILTGTKRRGEIL